MEERKQKEIDYYDQQAKVETSGKKESGSLHTFDPFSLRSYRFLKEYFQNNYHDKAVLDYGCGTGVHLPWLAKAFVKVTGIDLSQVSLDKARALVKKEGLEQKVVLQVGDCETLEFSPESFDAVFDGGTFSSLDLHTALRQIHRVLKPGGFLIGIETLGHNPITNLKRKLNELLGKRTSWAAGHIFKMQDLELVKKYFDIVQLQFFHLTSWIAIPLLHLPGGKMFLKMLEDLDHMLLTTFPFLKKYSFKIVFVFKKKHEKII